MPIGNLWSATGEYFWEVPLGKGMGGIACLGPRFGLRLWHSMSSLFELVIVRCVFLFLSCEIVVKN